MGCSTRLGLISTVVKLYRMDEYLHSTKNYGRDYSFMSQDRYIFIMGIPIPEKRAFILNRGHASS